MKFKTRQLRDCIVRNICKIGPLHSFVFAPSSFHDAFTVLEIQSFTHSSEIVADSKYQKEMECKSEIIHTSFIFCENQRLFFILPFITQKQDGNPSQWLSSSTTCSTMKKGVNYVTLIICCCYKIKCCMAKVNQLYKEPLSCNQCSSQKKWLQIIQLMGGTHNITHARRISDQKLKG